MLSGLLVNFIYKEYNYLGVTKDDGVVFVSEGDACLEADQPFLNRDVQESYLELAEKKPVDVGFDEIQLLPPVLNSKRVICVGLNYDMHVKETGRSHGEYPVLFTRFASTQVAHGDALIIPKESEQLDFEGEMALVIGKRGRRILAKDAFDYVAGYSCYNDASVRDWQFHTHQYTPGKNFPATGGFGPGLMPAFSVSNLDEMELKTELNGEIVQRAYIGDMIFSIPEIIEYVSRFTELEPGDVIVTGTPGGVGFKRNPPLFLRDGDTVTISVGGVGTLKNTVALEAD